MRRNVPYWLVLAALGLMGASCDTSGDRGVLDLVIVGLPPGTEADVRVTGPSSYDRAFTDSVRIENLRAGTYVVTAQRVAPFDPVDPRQEVDVIVDDEVTVEVVYADTSSQVHECAPYEPTEAAANEAGEWALPNDEAVRGFTVPADPGGGWVEVSVITETTAQPWLISDAAGAEPGTITSSGSDGRTRTDAFEVAPGEAYTSTFYEWVNAPVEDHPLAWSWSWAFYSTVDCYEPNDDFASAKAIPTGVTIQAYAIAGHRDPVIPDTAPHTFDWYRFTLAQDAATELEIVDTPANMDVRVRLFDAAGAQVGTAIRPGPGGTLTAPLGTLAAGTWYLEVHPEPDTRVAIVSAGEPVPDHFSTPYQLRVDAAAP